MGVDHPVFGHRNDVTDNLGLAGRQAAGAGARAIVQFRCRFLNFQSGSFADFRKAVQRPAHRCLGEAEMLGKLFEVDDILRHGRALIVQTALIMALFLDIFQVPLWMQLPADAMICG